MTASKKLLERTYKVTENPGLQLGAIVFLNGAFIVRSFKDLDVAVEIDLARMWDVNNTGTKQPDSPAN